MGIRFFKEHHAVENMRKRAREGHTLVIEYEHKMEKREASIGMGSVVWRIDS